MVRSAYCLKSTTWHLSTHTPTTNWDGFSINRYTIVLFRGGSPERGALVIVSKALWLPRNLQHPACDHSRSFRIKTCRGYYCQREKSSRTQVQVSYIQTLEIFEISIIRSRRILGSNAFWHSYLAVYFQHAIPNMLLMAAMRMPFRTFVGMLVLFSKSDLRMQHLSIPWFPS